MDLRCRELVPQVQQRGVQGCQEILQAILDGVLANPTSTRVHVVDLMPTRQTPFFVRSSFV